MEENKVLDTNLLIDGETGITTILNIIEYPNALAEQDNQIIWPTRSDYVTAIDLMILLLELGKPIPAVDVLLSAICLNRKMTLVTKDNHFKYVKSVKNELSLELRLTKKE